MEGCKIHEWETIIYEGKVKLTIPNPELFKRPDGIYEPAWAPVFYNPRMTFSRTLGVVVANTYFNNKEFFFVEPLAGIGVRSIRYVVEAYGTGIINDIDPIAYNYIIRNIKLNNISEAATASNSEANSLLNSIRSEGIVIDLIDIDPYGTPIPFIDSSSYAIAKGGLLAVTATDTGPLNCSHPQVCYRRYNSLCYKTDFSKEMGLRILIGSIIRCAASHDVGLEPIISYYHGYYYRVYFRATRSAKSADKVLRNIGYIIYNPNTLKREYIRIEDIKEVPVEEGVLCGPLWIGPLCDINFLLKINKTLAKRYSVYIEDIEPFINMLINECGINKPYYRYDKLFGMLKKNIPPKRLFINELQKQGFRACETHFDPRGIKTDAGIEDLINIANSITR